MRVSTQFPIAVHCMLWIAGFPDIKATSERLADSTGCNPTIIRNIYSKLNTAGLIITKSGKGKTTLAKSADDITLWDIYTAVESPETDELFKFHPNRSETCIVGSNVYDVLHPHLDDAVNAMKNELTQVTLANLCEELYEKIPEEMRP